MWYAMDLVRLPRQVTTGKGKQYIYHVDYDTLIRLEMK
jgi:hypothetical protein